MLYWHNMSWLSNRITYNRQKTKTNTYIYIICALVIKYLDVLFIVWRYYFLKALYKIKDIFQHITWVQI